MERDPASLPDMRGLAWFQVYHRRCPGQATSAQSLRSVLGRRQGALLSTPTSPSCSAVCPQLGLCVPEK